MRVCDGPAVAKNVQRFLRNAVALVGVAMMALYGGCIDIIHVFDSREYPNRPPSMSRVHTCRIHNMNGTAARWARFFQFV